MLPFFIVSAPASKRNKERFFEYDQVFNFNQNDNENARSGKLTSALFIVPGGMSKHLRWFFFATPLFLILGEWLFAHINGDVLINAFLVFIVQPILLVVVFYIFRSPVPLSIKYKFLPSIVINNKLKKYMSNTLFRIFEEESKFLFLILYNSFGFNTYYKNSLMDFSLPRNRQVQFTKLALHDFFFPSESNLYDFTKVWIHLLAPTWISAIAIMGNLIFFSSCFTTQSMLLSAFAWVIFSIYYVLHQFPIWMENLSIHNAELELNLIPPIIPNILEKIEDYQYALNISMNNRSIRVIELLFGLVFVVFCTIIAGVESRQSSCCEVGFSKAFESWTISFSATNK